MRVKCAGCREWIGKEGALTYGLGHVCNVECRDVAVKKARNVSRMRMQPTNLGGQRPQPTAARKAQVRARDGNRCRFCQTTMNLHIHHIRYRSEQGTHVETNLITLCMAHHDRVHSRKRHWQPVLTELLRLQYEENRFLMVPEAERLVWGDDKEGGNLWRPNQTA